MKKQPIWPYFLIALFFTLVNPLPLFSFAPFLALLYRRRSLLYSLWVGAGCGLILDLLATTPFGSHALLILLTTLIVYRYRSNFVDKAIGLASFCILISLSFMILTRLLHLIYNHSLPITWQGMITDFLIFPFIDGVYALLFFTFPLTLYRFLKKEYFRFRFLWKGSTTKEEES